MKGFNNSPCLYKWDLEVLDFPNVIKSQRFSYIRGPLEYFSGCYYWGCRRSPVGLLYTCLLRICGNSHDRGEILGRPRRDGRQWSIEEGMLWAFDRDWAELYQWLVVCPWTGYLISPDQLTSPMNGISFVAFFLRLLKYGCKIDT